MSVQLTPAEAYAHWCNCLDAAFPQIRRGLALGQDPAELACDLGTAYAAHDRIGDASPQLLAAALVRMVAAHPPILGVVGA